MNENEKFIEKQRQIIDKLANHMMKLPPIDNCIALARSLINLLQWTQIYKFSKEDRIEFIKKSKKEAEYIKKILESLIDEDDL